MLDVRALSAGSLTVVIAVQPENKLVPKVPVPIPVRSTTFDVGVSVPKPTVVSSVQPENVMLAKSLLAGSFTVVI